MKFTLEYPVGGRGQEHDRALLGGAGVAALVGAADRLGIDAVAFTEHPAPSQKWLTHGGHDTLGLASALAFCAAVSERIRLMTYLLVLPYYNPFAVAKELTTIDLLSDGRLTVVAGAGYLRSEFLALGVDFESRNQRLDEGMEVIRALWMSSGEATTFEGRFFTGKGVAHVPGPVQDGGPPVLIGGNSGIARRRAARHQGWSPLVLSETLAATTRMPSLTMDVLAGRVAEVRRLAAEAQGPEAPFAVQVQTEHADVLTTPSVSVEEHRDHLGALADAGVDSFVIRVPTASVAAAVEGLDRYATTYAA